MANKNSKTTKADNSTRPPVVVILGHVDHGKTSILDYIRKSKVAEGESGGITQHTGAYQVQQDDKLITFIDTPGHEAFSAMRSRGAHVADLAILVVAADDGVMPQTKEAISHIQKAGMPMIVAINKIDMPQADIQRVKNKLLEENVTLEGFGGDIPNVEVSAKTGQGIDDLLDIINLVSELEEFGSDEDSELEMVVVESAMDSQRGALATLLVKKGTLKINDIIAGNSAWARVKHLEDFQGESIQEAGPSTPVVVLGFNTVPSVGEKFVIVVNQKEAEERIARKQRKSDEGHLLEVEEGHRIVNVIIKSDVDGTLEAINEVIQSIEGEDFTLRILSEGVGEVNDSDVRLALNGQAILVAFRVKTNPIAQALARNNETPILTYTTIYELVEGMRAAILQQLDPVVTETVIGKLEVLEIFRTEPARMIVGGKIIAGELVSKATLRVLREGEELGKGKLLRLQQGTTVVEKSGEGSEVGILFEGEIRIEKGDLLEAIVREKSKPSLS